MNRKALPNSLQSQPMLLTSRSYFRHIKHALILSLWLLFLVACNQGESTPTPTATSLFVVPPSMPILTTQQELGFATPTRVPTLPPTPTPIPENTPAQAGAPGITSWTLRDFPSGLEGPPNERFFLSLVEVRRIDNRGGELLIKMNPVVNPNCAQFFRVGWAFQVGLDASRDVSVLHEGETVTTLLSIEAQGDSQPGFLRDCYVQAKREMVYGGEVIVAVNVSGGSHFLTQPGYVPYQQGQSQYLFAPLENPGAVYPVDPGFPANVGSITVTFDARDGPTFAGSADAPHGNFSIAVQAGEVFRYAVTYLYDAVLAQ